MTITKLAITYLLTTVVFFAIDLLWLGVVAKPIYNKYLQSFLAENVNWFAAIVFYLLFIVGIFYFCILPGLEKDDFRKVLVSGAFFGFITYATYDLTNLATLKNWPLPIVLIDIAWGSVLTAIVSISGFYIAKFLN
jgi:uncharacterized membrane protein